MPKSRNCARMVLSKESPPYSRKNLTAASFGSCREFIAVLLLNFSGDLRDVIARITAFGEIDFFPERLAIARLDREAEIFHLVAGVVDVIFALDIKAGGFVQARQTSPITATRP